MEQIETQASDLRYLAQAAPVALSDSASVSYETPQPRPQQGSPAGSATFGDNSAGGGPGAGSGASKRKSVDDGPGSGQKQTRSKRNRVSSPLIDSGDAVARRMSPRWMLRSRGPPPNVCSPCATRPRGAPCDPSLGEVDHFAPRTAVSRVSQNFLHGRLNYSKCPADIPSL